MLRNVNFFLNFRFVFAHFYDCEACVLSSLIFTYRYARWPVVAPNFSLFLIGKCVIPDKIRAWERIIGIPVSFVCETKDNLTGDNDAINLGTSM